jgi:hypothetical protein
LTKRSRWGLRAARRSYVSRCAKASATSCGDRPKPSDQQ